MKQILAILTFSLLGTCAFAQEETLFGNAAFVGGFGAPIFEFGLGGDPRHSAGLGGGVVVDGFFFGAYGLAGLDLKELTNEAGDVEQLDIAHGGFWLGYTYAPHKVIHPYVSARIGWGAVNIRLDDPFQTYEDVDKIFAFTPELGAELNITRWFRVAGTGGYRVISGVRENSGYSNGDFSGWTAAVTLRFGSFGRRY